MTRPRASTVTLAMVVAAVLSVAFTGALWSPQDPTAPVGAPWSGQAGGSPLGTDALGRDVWSRLLAGGRDLVAVAVLAGCVATGLGTATGLAAAWTRRAERLVRQVSAGLIAVPGILVVLVCAMAFPSPVAVLAGMLLLGAPLSARVVHATAVGLRQVGFVRAAQVRGEPGASVLVRELLPAVAGTVLADAGLRIVGALQLAVAVHILGFGPAPPAADWALMIRENLPGAALNPASVLAPAAALILVAVVLTAGVDVLAGRLVPGLATARSSPIRIRRGAARAIDPVPATGTSVVSLHGVHLRGEGFTLRVPELRIGDGEVVGLVGPSGAGKSTLLGLLAGQLRPNLSLSSGQLHGAGRPVRPGTAASRRWRRRTIGLLPQDPATTLDPLRRAGATVADGFTARLTRRERRRRIAEVLARLDLPVDAARRYPYTLSGGQAGRIALARAVVGEPALLLADEPTAGLDPETAARVRDEIARRRRPGMATVVVSHDRQWLARMADRVLEVAGGTVRPAGTHSPPRRRATQRVTGAPVLRVAALSVAQPPGGIPLLSGFDLTLHAGELVALLGPSGFGKSTLLRTLCGLHPPEAGRVWLRTDAGWHRIADAGPPVVRRPHGGRAPRLPGDGSVARWPLAWRRGITLLGQDPASELNPAYRLVTSVARPRRLLHGEPTGAARAHAEAMLAEVGLAPELARRRPGACSGGQRQRAALARALATEPAVLLADEPTSALDSATAGAMLDLLDARRRRGLAVLLVTHDDEVAARADTILRMELSSPARPAPRPELAIG